jgi:DNA-binding XRE family transcriptional regulator
MGTKIRSNVLQLDSTQASSSTQAATKTVLKDLGLEYKVRTDFWEAFKLGQASELPSNMVVVASLSRVAKTFLHTAPGTWTAGVRIAKPCLVSVSTAKDHVSAQDLERILRASDGRLTVCGPNSLPECLAKATATIGPHGVVDVTYSDVDRTLWLMFGDGLRGPVSWSALRLDDRKPELRPETVRVGDDPETVVLSDAEGGEFEIDTASLRSLLDKDTDARLKGVAIESALTLGETLAKARTAKNLTQDEVAKRSGLTQEAISRLESGKHWPHIDTLRNYARALGVSVSNLLSAGEEPALKKIIRLKR